MCHSHICSSWCHGVHFSCHCLFSSSLLFSPVHLCVSPPLLPAFLSLSFSLRRCPPPLPSATCAGRHHTHTHTHREREREGMWSRPWTADQESGHRRKTEREREENTEQETRGKIIRYVYIMGYKHTYTSRKRGSFLAHVIRGISTYPIVHANQIFLRNCISMKLKLELSCFSRTSLLL